MTACAVFPIVHNIIYLVLYSQLCICYYIITEDNEFSSEYIAWLAAMIVVRCAFVIGYTMSITMPARRLYVFSAVMMLVVSILFESFPTLIIMLMIKKLKYSFIATTSCMTVSSLLCSFIYLATLTNKTNKKPKNYQISTIDTDECAICLQPMTKCCKLSCGHHFHEQCYIQSVRYTDTRCPICRQG
jgi:hypothetical protein